MTDEHLRELERRVRETGTVADRALLLRARTQAGLLEEQALRFAAYLGDPAALLAFGSTPEPPAPTLDSELFSEAEARLDAWARGIEEWGHSACVRSAVALALHLLPRFEQAHPQDDRPRVAIRAALEALVFPTERHAHEEQPEGQHLEDATSAAHDASTIAGGGQVCHRASADRPISPPPVWAAMTAACTVGLAGSSFAAGHEQGEPGPGRRLAILMSYACKALDPAEVRAAVAQGVVPWILGEADPLLAWLEPQGRVAWPAYQPPPPVPDIDIRWVKWRPELCGVPGWCEHDDEGWTIRQIERAAVGAQPREVFPERTEDRWYLSSWGDGLGDGQLTRENLWTSVQEGLIEIITQAEFEATWQAALQSRRPEWDAFKTSLRAGTNLQATSRAIWGRLGWVAVELDRPFLGVLSLTAYQALAASRGAILGVGWNLAVVVRDFDDERQWVVLELEP